MTIRCGDRAGICSAVRVFRNIEAVIFDKDGTLEDSQSYLRELGIKRARLIDAQIPGIGEPLLMAFGMQNNQLDPAGLMAVGSRHENEIAAAAYIAETGRSWFESLAIARSSFSDADQYCQPDMNSSPMFAGSLDVIKTLSDAGLKIAILSAASTPSVERFVRDHQLSPYLSLLMGAEQGLTKPNPVFFLKACEALGVKPEATLMVGDSQGDMEMSKKANAAGAIGICWGTGSKSHLQKADVIINHLDQIQIEE